MKKFKFVINGHKYEVNVEELEKDTAEVVVNGTPFTVEIEAEKKKSIAVVSPTLRRAGAAPKGVAAAAAPKSTSNVLKSELPGSIVKIVTSAGQAVKRGDVLLTIESMKMENSIMADCDGTVKAIFVSEGQSVMQGDKLAEIEGVATAAPIATPVETPQAPKAPAPQAAPAAKPAAPSTGAEGVKSPLPGSVIKVMVSEGQSVKRGETFLTMESMKMENAIMAERDCVVKSVRVSEGQSVMQDDLLLEIQ